MIGMVLGVAGSIAAFRVVESLIYGLDPVDWISLSLSADCVLGLCICAAALPIWRAVKVGIVQVLREE
jgi:ABC-type lipoprotein release transport system permease subunit